MSPVSSVNHVPGSYTTVVAPAKAGIQVGRRCVIVQIGPRLSYQNEPGGPEPHRYRHALVSEKDAALDPRAKKLLDASE